MNITISKGPLPKPRLRLNELEGGKFYTSSRENNDSIYYQELSWNKNVIVFWGSGMVVVNKNSVGWDNVWFTELDSVDIKIVHRN